MTKSIVRKHGYYRDIQLAKGLVKQGHEVCFLAASASWRGGVEIVRGVNVHTFFDPSPYQIKKGGLSFVDMVSRLFFLLGKKFDVVFVDSGFRPVTGIPGHLYAWFYNVPYVCEWWDWLGKGGLYERKSELYKRSLGILDNYFEIADKKCADGIVPLSHKLMERAENLGISKDRLMILHGGADLSLNEAPSKEEARRLLDIPVDSRVVGFAGLDEQEAEDLGPFFESIRELKSRLPNFVWFSTGGVLSNDLKKKYGIGEEYFEFGWTDYRRYAACLKSADVLLLTQEDNLINQARWPNKIGDYMAVGRPILATPIGEVKFFVEKYPDIGIRLVNWDSNAISNALVEMLANGGNLSELGRVNAMVAREQCSWGLKSKNLSDFLEKIVRMGRRG